MRCRRNPTPLFFTICSPDRTYGSSAYSIDPDGDVYHGGGNVGWDSCGSSPYLGNFDDSYRIDDTGTIGNLGPVIMSSYGIK